ncbi:hypothetical protein [Knoellia sinensis]|uniref:hypothetical protein n=1 Tax=Knoellia sinensis TaxID=136100 RepID=UPI000AEA6842|nr:hypothetical protein [Knoellia sinensis]
MPTLKACDNDAGWRIDCHVASSGLAKLAIRAEVGRATAYAECWSDHGAVTVDYGITLD